MKKVAMKGPTKDLRISRSSFLIMCQWKKPNRWHHLFLNWSVWMINHRVRFIFVHRNAFYQQQPKPLLLMPAKIMLSDKELALVNDAEPILTKQRIMAKVQSFFADVNLVQQTWMNANAGRLQPAWTSSSPKISKGEQYRGLPYVVLDYPRCFQQDSLFAIRTLFWWGNFFSLQLLVQGEHQLRLSAKLLENWEDWVTLKACICVHPSPWEHHFENDNFKLLGEMDTEEYSNIIISHSFLKIGFQHPLEQWDDLPEWLMSGFEKLMELAAND